MSEAGMNGLVINIPELHPELVKAAFPGGVKFFDPGLRRETGGTFFLSPLLPFNPKQASQMLGSFAGLNRDFPRPGELSAFARAQMDAMSRRKGMDETEAADLGRFLLSQGLPGDVRQVEKSSPEKSLALSQQVLLLAWQMEEYGLELRGIPDDLARSLKVFDEALGLEGDFPGGRGLHGEFSGEAFPGDWEDLVPPWPLVVEHIVRFLPEGGALLTTRRELRSIWEDRGCVFHPLEAWDRELLGLSGEEEKAWLKSRIRLEELTDRKAIKGQADVVTVYAPAS